MMLSFVRFFDGKIARLPTLFKNDYRCDSLMVHGVKLAL